MKTTTNTKPTNTAPFDGSARQRLAHMGVLTAGGKPAGAVMPVFAGIFGGSFFDDFVALYQKPSELRSIYNIFADLLAKRA